ncbi:MAG: hypothetical protein HOP29_05750 [Phycisphaerales bacterium]|nr:hypothetical protein [Phycisphaerales bacterium]
MTETYSPAVRVWGHGLRLTLLAAIVSTGCVAHHSTAQRAAESPFALPGNHDEAIPTPQSVIGHAVGATAVRYDALVKYLHALDEASPYVTMTPYAESHEGRTLYYVTIASEQNHRRLNEIQTGAARLADPRLLADDAEAEQLVQSLPGIAWMAYSIHGDELSGADAAMQLAYQLAAGWDDETRRLRDELVIHIDPSMNPDGRERYLTQLQQLTGKISNTDPQSMQHAGLWSAGRGNHYLFDLNRDWLMQVHPETRGRSAVIQSWHPVLVVDSHEMGNQDTYLFDPPRDPVNPALGESVLNWRRRFSADQAKAFDRHGWSYYTGEWYEEWYPGYTNAWASLNGAIGLLYEQASLSAASVKQASGEIAHYRDAVHHQLVSSLANLETLRTHRADLWRAYLDDRRWAVSDRGPFDEVFLLPPPDDRSKLLRFTDLLKRQGIECGTSLAAFEGRGLRDVWGQQIAARTFPAGTLVVRSDQPQRRILHAILGFDPRPSDEFLREERTELENRRDTRIYDVTAWNLSMAYGLDTFWADDIGDVTTRPIDANGGSNGTWAVPAARGQVRENDAPVYGWMVNGNDGAVHAAIVRLLDAGFTPRVASKSVSVHDRHYDSGSVLLRGHENPPGAAEFVQGLAESLGVEVNPVATALSQTGPDLGGQRFHLLERPRVAIATQWPMSTTSFGSLWHLLDARVGLRVSPINIQHLDEIDLRIYNVLILPDTDSPDKLRAMLGESGLDLVKAWVESGGTLIAVGASAAVVADKDHGIGSVRIRRDVLDKLDEYSEAVDREWSARDVRIDSRSVWGEPQPAVASPPDEAKNNGDTGNGSKHVGGNDAAANGDSKDDKDDKDDIETLKRRDEWLRLFSPVGVIAAGVLNSEHWLCFGAGPRLPVFVSGDYAFMSKPPVVTPVRLDDASHLRLSGLLWPEARERLGRSAWATVERVERGQVILFAADPFFRGYFEGTGRLFLNAVILGPGMGASTPLPW